MESATSPPALTWSTDADFVLEGTGFRATPFHPAPSTAEHFHLLKPRELIEKYTRIIDDEHPRRIFELGIFFGGSTAFLAHYAKPEVLVAVDIRPNAVGALEQFIDMHGYRSTVKAHYGVDQSDRTTLERLLREEFGDGPLDMVLDDASHELTRTRDSFNILFSHVRPGGLYIIEDWSWGLFPFAVDRPRSSLSVLVFELLMTLPWRQYMIDEIVVDQYWAFIRKGHGRPPEGQFDLANCYGPRARAYVDALTTGFEAYGVDP